MDFICLRVNLPKIHITCPLLTYYKWLININHFRSIADVDVKLLMVMIHCSSILSHTLTVFCPWQLLVLPLACFHFSLWTLCVCSSDGWFDSSAVFASYQVAFSNSLMMPSYKQQGKAKTQVCVVFPFYLLLLGWDANQAVSMSLWMFFSIIDIHVEVFPLSTLVHKYLMCSQLLKIKRWGNMKG